MQRHLKETEVNCIICYELDDTNAPLCRAAPVDMTQWDIKLLQKIKKKKNEKWKKKKMKWNDAMEKKR